MKAKKKRNKPYRPRQAKTSSMAVTLVGNMTEQLNAMSHRDILLRIYQAMDDLVSGRLDIEGFYLLNGMNMSAHILADMIGAQGTPRVKEAMAENTVLTLAAADALIGIGVRQGKTGKFGASGEEVKKLRAAFGMYDSLAEAAPTGLVLRSLQATDKEMEAATHRGNAIRKQEQGK